MSVNNIRHNSYTVNSMACVVDIHLGFNLCDIDVIRIVEPAYLGTERIMGSSLSVKRIYREVEKDMNLEIDFTLICERKEKGQIIDGVKLDTKDLFLYLINHFGLSEKAKTGMVEIAQL
jgi:hypothetical protein